MDRTDRNQEKIHNVYFPIHLKLARVKYNRAMHLTK